MLDAWPGATGEKGAAFPLREAQARAATLRRRFVGGRTVVLLGRRVAAAFGVFGEDYFRRLSTRGATLVVVPHPSSVNRWFNDARNVETMCAFMRNVSEVRR